MEAEWKNTGNLTINSHIGLEIQVVDHSLDVLGIHSHCEVSYSEDKNMDSHKVQNNLYSSSLAWE